MTTATKYEAIIGLETHCQLNTNTKIFCNCSTNFDSPPNTNVCPICLGHPGVLPVLNEEVLNSAIKMGLAIEGQIASYSKFDRKQYFYPDLPKNYQISQYDLPIVEHGKLEIELVDPKTKEVRKKIIGITRLHMEEDAGKLVHGGSDRLAGSTHSLVDFNRTGIPLLEIVSEPDLRSGQEASEYAQELRRVVRYLGIGNGNMQEGSLRCDVNISVRPVGRKEFGVKVEIKNMNSFSAIQKAIEYEIERQIDTIENGGKILQETRLWDEGKQCTFSMRIKEGSSDYRYFPEPDLQPLKVTQEFIERAKSEMPELPDAMRDRFMSEYELSFNDASQIVLDKSLAEFYETTAKNSGNPRTSANFILSELTRELNNANKSASDSPVSAENLAELIKVLDAGKINNNQAKEVIVEMFASGKDAAAVISEKGFEQISDSSEIEKIVDEIIKNNENQVNAYRGGNDKLFGFFVGQTMKASQGKANPKIVNEILREKLR